MVNLLDLGGLPPCISGVPGLEYPESYRSLGFAAVGLDIGGGSDRRGTAFDRGAVSARRRVGTSLSSRTWNVDDRVGPPRAPPAAPLMPPEEAGVGVAVAVAAVRREAGRPRNGESPASMGGSLRSALDRAGGSSRMGWVRLAEERRAVSPETGSIVS